MYPVEQAGSVHPSPYKIQYPLLHRKESLPTTDLSRPIRYTRCRLTQTEYLCTAGGIQSFSYGFLPFGILIPLRKGHSPPPGTPRLPTYPNLLMPCMQMPYPIDPGFDDIVHRKPFC